MDNHLKNDTQGLDLALLGISVGGLFSSTLSMNPISFTTTLASAALLINNNNDMKHLSFVKGLVDEGNGMVITPYSTYGAQGIWYTAWDGSDILPGTPGLNFGTYPYANNPCLR